MTCSLKPDNCEIEALRAANKALAILANKQWQPIKTAPKDGTHFLCASEGWVSEVYWDADQKCCYAANTHSTDYVDGAVWPTHWMPLPEPPK